jgi:HD-GYP domain-containing protein (c-di-GMP phosphodiesterase class II)
LEATLDAIRYHHEAYDGTGYPLGLTGTGIPLSARIMAVADAYSAMTMDRPYRKGMDSRQAMTILEQGAGRQWDADCVSAFIKARQESSGPSPSHVAWPDESPKPQAVVS